MTKPRYLKRSCAAGSKARGLASSTPDASNPDDYAWGVNFNNGNTNINNRDNNGFVRAVRSVAGAASPGEFQGDAQIRLHDVYCAWRRARRRKRPSSNRLRLEACQGTPESFRRIRSVWRSYEGHFRHARSWMLRHQLLREFPWLAAVVHPRRWHWQAEGLPCVLESEALWAS